MIYWSSHSVYKCHFSYEPFNLMCLDFVFPEQAGHSRICDSRLSFKKIKVVPCKSKPVPWNNHANNSYSKLIIGTQYFQSYFGSIWYFRSFRTVVVHLSWILYAFTRLLVVEKLRTGFLVCSWIPFVSIYTSWKNLSSYLVSYSFKTTHNLQNLIREMDI